MNLPLPSLSHPLGLKGGESQALHARRPCTNLCPPSRCSYWLYTLRAVCPDRVVRCSSLSLSRGSSGRHWLPASFPEWKPPALRTHPCVGYYNMPAHGRQITTCWIEWVVPTNEFQCLGDLDCTPARHPNSASPEAFISRTQLSVSRTLC